MKLKGRADRDWNDQMKRERGGRLKALRERLGLTVERMAAELNDVANGLGFPEVWSGSRISKIETGGQNLSIEDVTVLALFTGDINGWYWWAFERDLPETNEALERATPGEPVVMLDAPDDAKSAERKA